MAVPGGFEDKETPFEPSTPRFLTGIPVRDRVSGPMVTKRSPKATRTNSDEWLTPREVAEYLRTGVDLIYDACATGGLKHVKLGHRTIRVRRAWVDAWIEAKATESG
jgi:excisionase family DNA binding protein